MAGRRYFRWLIGGSEALLLALVLSSWVALAGQGLATFQRWAWDFLSLYTGARMVWDGQGADLYNLEAQMRYQEDLLAPRRVASGGLPFYYPPTILPFLLPFAWASLPLAYFLWLLFSLLLVALFILLAWRMIGREHRLTFLLALFSFYPLSNHLLQGQTTLLLLVGFTLAFLFLERGREGAAGLALALGSIKPPLVLPLLLVLLGKRRWQVLGGLAIGSFLLLGPPLLFLGPSALTDYLSLTLRMLGAREAYGLFPEAMHNWRAFSWRLLGSGPAGNLLLLGLTLLSLGLLGWIWRHPWEERSPRFPLQFASTVLLTLLVSPHLNLHDLVLWLLAGTLIAHASRGKGAEWRWGWVFLLLGGLVPLVNPLWPRPFGPPTVLLAVGAVLWLLGRIEASRPSKGERVAGDTGQDGEKLLQ